ncbi:MAG: gliding motility-associated ABC transporter ATP-binding subunit GldA, partial [Bacteroidetes bacterium]|nr:gliding motility-associated ABC transporter ATP-binding subunit GldA [Bacteroidota bacterium]
LDPNQLHEIRQLIREIGSEKSVLLSTHIMQEVEALCDRIIIINKGKILANEKTESLKNKHQGNIYRIEFLEKVPLQQLQNHFTKDTVKSLDSTQNVFHLQQSAGLNEDLRPEIFNFSVKNNFTLIGLQKEQNRLEDVFQAITQMS